MPKEIYAIWWDDHLGPIVGRSFPEGTDLTSEEALTIFMGHGVNQEARVGYANLKKGLVVSIMEPPNCIAVLLDEEDNPQLIERNLIRLVSLLDLNTSSWDFEMAKAFDQLNQLIDRSTGDELLAQPEIRRMLEDLVEGRIEKLVPESRLVSVQRYPIAADYLAKKDDEITRTLGDLEDARLLIAKTYGRQVQCRRCGSNEVRMALVCPNCKNETLYKVYQLSCNKCGNRTQSIILDDLEAVKCQHCDNEMPVSKLTIMEVEILCQECSTATDEPRIVLYCAKCETKLQNADLLGGTGLAYYPRMRVNAEE